MLPILSIKKFLEYVRTRDLDLSSEKEQVVLAILNDIKKDGDTALLKYIRKFDHPQVELDTLFLDESEIQMAKAALPKEIKDVIDEAFDNIYYYHQLQKSTSFFTQKDGVFMGQILRPLEKVGAYVPGGEGIYPSSLLMNCIPAMIAEVPEIYVACPPNKNGELDLSIVYAAQKCGVKKIFRMGGAHAIAALAYGTESIPRVHKITGPGNMYVTLAKKLVYGQVDIDMVSGPSEIVILADSETDEDMIVADMFSQAEHADDSSAVLFIDSKEKAESINAKMESAMNKSPRKKYLEKSLLTYGKIVIYKKIEEAFEGINSFAPEHLEVLVPMEIGTIAQYIKNVGCIFLGAYSPVASGDYFAGINHNLPTNGTAHFFSPLGVYDFIKRTSVVQYNKNTFLRDAKKIKTFAKYEGFHEHANSIQTRLERK